MRSHQPKVLDSFQGHWEKGSPEEVPPDHFQDCENIRFVGTKAFASRHGIDRHQSVVTPLGNIVRMYNYITQDKNTLLVLTYDGTTGNLYHVVDGATAPSLILTKTGMEDFGFVPYAGRAYITPFKSTLTGGLYIEKGLSGEFLYVYLGAGVAARKAGGNPPSGTLSIANGAAGYTDAGFKLFGVVFESDTGYLSAPAAFNSFTTVGNTSVSFSNVPISAQGHIVKRHIVATITIKNYNGDTTGYTYYFIPDAVIPDNVSTNLINVSFFDADLLEDASHLLDNFAEIPAGVALNIYHNRLCLTTTFTDISIVYVSAIGEPEAINQIDGILIVPPDGNPITNLQELRDILYVMKRNKTVSFVDNNDAPSSWPMTVIDQAIGCPVHGIATVIDSGGSNVDFLILASYKGVIIFTGRYILPELSWKISQFWQDQSLVEFRKIQILNDSIKQILYITLPDRRLEIGDYANGLDPEKIRWAPWKFDITVNTIALININTLILGAETRQTL